jgi:hypothetical protein
MNKNADDVGWWFALSCLAAGVATLLTSIFILH